MVQIPSHDSIMAGLRGQKAPLQPQPKPPKPTLTAALVGEKPKSGVKPTVNFLKDVARSVLRFPVSAGEAAVRVPAEIAETVTKGKIKAPDEIQPKKIPGLGALGKIESYQSEAIRKQKQGEAPASTIGRTAVDIALDEPLGIALKPAFIGLGLFGKFLGKGAAKSDLPKKPDTQVAQDVPVDRPIQPTIKEAVTPQTGKTVQAAESPQTPLKQVPEVAPSGIQRGLSNFKTAAQEKIQDSAIRVRQLVNRPDVKVSDVSDPYLKMDLFSGRVGSQIEGAFKETQGVFDELQELSKISRKPFNELRKELSDYLYLRHAPERNLALKEGAAGIGTKAAQQALKAIETSPQGEKVKELAGRLSNLHKKSLEMLKESGVISDDLYKNLTTKYKHHVPLQRIFEDSEDIGSILSARGFDVKSTGIKRAVGSEREVDDIIENILHNYQEAVLRSEKNIVDNATLNFVRDNPQLSEIFEIIKPRAIATDFEGKPILESTNDPRILQMYENGKKVWIKVKDKRLAIALRGVGREKLGDIMRVVATVTRYFSSLATRFNPEFFLPNKIRDLQETAVYLASQKGIGAKGALSAVKKDPGSLKDVYDFIDGKKTPGAALYEEMRRLGGTTGGFGLSTKKQVELDIKTLEQLATSPTKRALNNFVNYIDDWNQVFEDSTRLSVYKTALERGLSKERAAQMAKEASINFNKMGTGGPVINGLWMFANASIQGSTKMLRALRNPKTAAGVVTAMTASVAAVNQFNDNVNPNWRQEVTKYDRLNGLPIFLPSTKEGDSRYFILPVSWGLKPLKVMADFAYDASSGVAVDAKQVMEDFATSLIEAYNPVGGTDIVSAVTPTILDIPSELSRNRAWSGSVIRPEYDRNAPESQKYFPSLKETGTGRTAIATAKELSKAGIEISPANMVYFVEQIFGGAGRAAKKFADTVWGVSTGNPPPIDESPLISRFYRQRSGEEVGAGSEDYKKVQQLKQEESRTRFEEREGAQAEWDSIKKLPTSAERKQRLLEIARQDPARAEKIIDIAENEKLNLTATERQLKSGTVRSRAMFLNEKLSELKTSEEKKALLLEYAQKKIITEAVLDELILLRSQ